MPAARDFEAYPFDCKITAGKFADMLSEHVSSDGHLR